MFDIDIYLKKLGYEGPLAPTPELLRELHKRHLMYVPFDNVLNKGRGDDIWEYVDIDVDETFDAVITGGRGGVCHEISGLFRVLLTRLGFDVAITSAGVRMAGGEFGPIREHMFHVVKFDGERHLVDVGLAGPSFLEPLILTDGVQHQYGVDYRLDQDERDGEYWTLNRRPAEGQWQPVYRFRDVERQLAEWRGDEDLRSYARDLNAAVTLIRGRAFDNGQSTLIGRRWIRIEDGKEHMRVLVKADEYEAVVNDILQGG
ncbi:arylamine N-acetyltransferase family protein [Streptomyces erythrochromogenes]|uniref:arylamine N-acetyltransferase family protein n=1 Tax=Streptomyces erythrochromogenes TaxID=285574 RepID=UPI0036C5D2CB